MAGITDFALAENLRAVARQKMLLPAFCALYFLLSLYVIAIFLIGSDFGGQYGHTFKNMLAGASERPMVYRMLLPVIADAVIHSLPDAFLQSINGWSASIRDSRLMSVIIHVHRPDMPPSLRDSSHLYESFVFVLLTWMCLCGYMAALYRMARYFMPQSRAYALLAPVFGALLLPVVHENFAYPYDYSTLLLVSLSLYCMARERWPAYYVLLALATMNKETAVYIPFVYAVYFFGRKPMKSYAAAVLAQLAVYAGISAAIRIYYEHSLVSRGLFSSTWTQLAILFHGYSYNTFVAMLVTFYLLTFRWREKPEFLRCGMWMWLPLLVAFLCLGYPNEYRQFLDIAPVATLLLTHTLVTAARSRGKESMMSSVAMRGGALRTRDIAGKL